ncbi:MAG: MATE family efflux transporter [Clostridia bacterium]|nr:MATE family efflux transporter [Clostridia bacterium]
MAKFENNLVEGSVTKQLILFSLPILLSNLIQTLYSVADMIIVGQFAGAVSMSGVNIGSQVTFLITNMVFGLSVGATVLIGQYLGADNRGAIQKTIGTLFSSLAVLALILTVSMLVLQNPLLKLIKTPEESFSEASRYFFVTTLGNIFIFGYNALSAVMRGLGDSKNPLVFVGIACVVNIVLDLLFVAIFKWGATGAAVATVISQAVSMILCIIYLKTNNFIFDFSKESLKVDKKQLSMILKLGIPSSIQNVATSASFLFLTALVNTIGYEASAAVGAVGKLNGFAILPAAAMSSAVSAMVAQNLGAGRIDRAKKTTGTGMLISIIISLVIFVFVSVFPEVCMRIFTNEQSVISKGAEYILAFRFDYLIVPFVFCLNGLYIGAGHTTVSLINGMISSILFRIPASYLFGMLMNLGLFGVGLGAPVASIASLIFGVAFYISGRWKKQIIVRG